LALNVLSTPDEYKMSWNLLFCKIQFQYFCDLATWQWASCAFFHVVDHSEIGLPYKAYANADLNANGSIFSLANRIPI
jgi:hypothetical protein